MVYHSSPEPRPSAERRPSPEPRRSPGPGPAGGGRRRPSPGRRPAGDAVPGLVVRSPRFDLAAPDPWIAGPAVVRLALDAVHLLPPVGEAWLVAAVGDAVAAGGGGMPADVGAFLGQERAHARAHGAAAGALAGYRVDLAAAVGAALRLGSAARRAAGRAPAPVRRRLLHVELAVLAAAELATAAFGDWVLGAAALDPLVNGGEALALLRWHGAEEVVHRHVALQVYDAACGSPLLRVAVAVPTVVGFHVAWWAATVALALADRRRPPLPGPATWMAAARRGLLPGPGLVAATLRQAARWRPDPGAVGCAERARAHLARYGGAPVPGGAPG